MIVGLRRRLAARFRVRAAFRLVHPGLQMRVIRIDVFDDFSVVTISTGLGVRPPTRAWWRVPDADDEPCRELSFDEASGVIGILTWR